MFIGAEWQSAVPWVDFQVPEKKGGLNREGGDWTWGVEGNGKLHFAGRVERYRESRPMEYSKLPVLSWSVVALLSSSRVMPTSPQEPVGGLGPRLRIVARFCF